MGELYFNATDIYGYTNTTTEKSIPEAEDQMALVDDQAAAAAGSTKTANKFNILGAILLLVFGALLIGAVR